MTSTSTNPTTPRRSDRSRPLRRGLALLALAAGLAASAGAAEAATTAWTLEGTKQLRAHTQDGQVIALGQVTFSPRADGQIGFTLDMNARQLTDHFLSMKEFKCLGGSGTATELVCHVPYPYAQPGTVTERDFAWLEHSLLFLYKKPSEFSAKLWNGLYYRLERTDTGLVGRPQAIDLNRISAPPDTLTVPPYKPAYRDDVAPGSRWIERLTLE
jgi:hypothetical protein